MDIVGCFVLFARSLASLGIAEVRRNAKKSSKISTNTIRKLRMGESEGKMVRVTGFSVSLKLFIATAMAVLVRVLYFISSNSVTHKILHTCDSEKF